MYFYTFSYLDKSDESVEETAAHLAHLTDAVHDGVLLGADVLARRELHAGVAAVDRVGDCV